jgi:tetratricopeptide (TPR) repeat protein
VLLAASFFLPGLPSAWAKTETWTEVKSPHFVVITNGSENEGRRVAVQFEQVRAVFLTFMEKARADASEPIRIVATKDEGTFRALLPQFFETKGHFHPTGVFQGGEERNYVVLRLDVEGEGAYDVLYHEYTHFLLQLNYGQLPIWLNEGVAEFYGHMQIGNKEVLVGRPALGHIRLLEATRWLPMDTLFSAGRDSPYYNEANKTSIFYAQSWGLIHYLMLEGKRAAAVNDYIHQIVLQHADPVEAAHRAFGDPAALTKALEACVRKGEFLQFTMKSPAPLEDTTFPARQISAAESLAIRGDFLAHSGREKEARPLLEEAVRQDPKLAAPHESLGLLALLARDYFGAVQKFARAVDLDSKSVLALFYSAQASLGPGATHAEALMHAETLLRKAVELNPEFAPAHAQLSYVLMAEEKNPEEAVQHAMRAVALEPGTPQYLLNAGMILIRLKRFEEAQKMGQRALTQARNPADAAQAQELIENAQKTAEWQRAAAERAKSTPTDIPAASSGTESAPETRFSPQPASVTGSVGRTERIKGVVTESSCTALVLNLRVTGESQSLQLRAGNYMKLQYEASSWEPPGNFSPCRHLKGHTVVATYTSLSPGPPDGEVTQIQVVE